MRRIEICEHHTSIVRRGNGEAVHLADFSLPSSHIMMIWSVLQTAQQGAVTLDIAEGVCTEGTGSRCPDAAPRDLAYDHDLPCTFDCGSALTGVLLSLRR